MKELRFVPPREPICDPNTGIMNPTWYLFFQNFFDPRYGEELQSAVLSVPNSNAIDAIAPLSGVVDGLAQAPSAVRDSQGDITADLAPLFVPARSEDDLSPDLGSILAQLAELAKTVDDMKKGTITL